MACLCVWSLCVVSVRGLVSRLEHCLFARITNEGRNGGMAEYNDVPRPHTPMFAGMFHGCSCSVEAHSARGVLDLEQFPSANFVVTTMRAGVVFLDTSSRSDCVVLLQQKRMRYSL